MPVAVANQQHEVRVPLPTLRRAAGRALRALGRPASHVEMLVVDDDGMRRLNRRFRGVGRRTDVLAFPLEVPGTGPLLGQVIVSAPTARRQARRLDVPLTTELELLVTHGVLHLVGYDDRDPVEAGLMHARERAILEEAHPFLPDQLWRGLLER